MLMLRTASPTMILGRSESSSWSSGRISIMGYSVLSALSELRNTTPPATVTPLSVEPNSRLTA